MGQFDERFDVVVVGGGHAGCEAAAAAARMGARTALFSLNLDLIAQMSCNPAIGGVAKGHLVREVDALGGVMGRVADRTGIQFRLLNASRGAAVQSPRCQSDKARYRAEMKRCLEDQADLFLRQAEVARLVLAGGAAAGIETVDGRRVGARAVVITTGTFLNGLIHIGGRRYAAGRNGEAASLNLGECLREMGFAVGRLKTGTPPRLDRRSIDFSRFEEQAGDADPTFFSFETGRVCLPQVSCHIGYTDERVHRVVRENLKRSALYGGEIIGVGPRYCPSIEDKIVKFPEKVRHQLFLEPEGLDTNEVYLNGLSTSMPAEVQNAMVQAVPGLEQARMIRPGYAIEYDFVQPSELKPTLEAERVAGLFHAGQINGTTGYEEAAAQGIVAGINAARCAAGSDPVVLPRHESYIGTLIDDLVTRGVDEPYRMFTSRAEFRLLLRIDNADRRLTPLGYSLGLVSHERHSAFQEKYRGIERLRAFLAVKRWSGEPPASLAGRVEAEQVKGRTMEELLRRPDTSFDDLRPALESAGLWLSREVRRAVEIEVRYQGYIAQQERDAHRLERAGACRIPEAFDYAQLDGLSREMREKLGRMRPVDLGAASRIPGVTPAALTLLHLHIELHRGKS